MQRQFELQVGRTDDIDVNNSKDLDRFMRAGAFKVPQKFGYENGRWKPLSEKEVD